MKMVDHDFAPPTREDLEAVLTDLGFKPKSTDPDLWLYPDGTKSVLFTDKGTSAGEALYSDAEQHECGKYINYRQICVAASGTLALSDPGFVKIALLGPPISASGGGGQTTKLLVANSETAAGEEIIEAEFEDLADAERAVDIAEAAAVLGDREKMLASIASMQSPKKATRRTLVEGTKVALLAVLCVLLTILLHRCWFGRV